LRFLPVVLTSITAIWGLLAIALNPNPLITPLAICIDRRADQFYYTIEGRNTRDIDPVFYDNVLKIKEKWLLFTSNPSCCLT
jgi:hypothetical protein